MTSPGPYQPHQGDLTRKHTPPVNVDPGLLPPPVTDPPPPPPPPRTTEPDDVHVRRDYPINYQPGPVVKPPGGAGPTPPTIPVPTSTALKVSLERLQSLERGLLASTAGLGDKQTALVDEVHNVSATIFGQTATFSAPRDHDPGSKNLSDYADVVQPDPLQDAAKDFAADIIPAMYTALENCAQTLQLAGAFVEALEAAGDAYATMDDHSRFATGDAAP